MFGVLCDSVDETQAPRWDREDSLSGARSEADSSQGACCETGPGRANGGDTEWYPLLRDELPSSEAWEESTPSVRNVRMQAVEAEDRLVAVRLQRRLRHEERAVPRLRTGERRRLRRRPRTLRHRGRNDMLRWCQRGVRKYRRRSLGGQQGRSGWRRAICEGGSPVGVFTNGEGLQ